MRPIPVTKITVVTHDTSNYKNPIAKRQCSYIDTSITFYECLNDKGTVGYVLDYHKSRRFETALSLWGEEEEEPLTSEGHSILVGLKEVQRVEQLLAKKLDLKADSSQEIQRALTAPRFYQYVRQYSFYQTMEGDTCAKINFAIPDEYTCLDSYYHDPCDGGDDFWRATVNLSKGRILDYSVNGPEIETVEGRSREPHGLANKNIFASGWTPFIKEIPFEQLPQRIQKQIDNPLDTTTRCYIFPHEGQDYYLITIGNIKKGYQNDGEWLFIGDENVFSGNLPVEKLQDVPHIKKMLSYIHKDMSRRGRDFEKYGKIRSLEMVNNHYVIFIWYYPNIDYYKMWAAYTFDRNGDFVGIDIDEWL